MGTKRNNGAADIKTISGEVFTGSESAELAFLLLKRWGRDEAAAASAWRRLTDSDLSTPEFVSLARSGESIRR